MRAIYIINLSATYLPDSILLKLFWAIALNKSGELGTIAKNKGHSNRMAQLQAHFDWA